jgi:hypothetical protein
MKICKKCLIEKPLNEFYNHPKTKDKKQQICKSCIKAESQTEDAKKRAKQADKKREQTEKRKLWKKDYIKSFYEENPEKRKAQHKVSNFLRFNKDFKREKCIICNNQSKIHYHHFDYKKPLEIIPCCVNCHYKLHKNEIQIQEGWILKLTKA